MCNVPLRERIQNIHSALILTNITQRGASHLLKCKDAHGLGGRKIIPLRTGQLHKIEVKYSSLENRNATYFVQTEARKKEV